MFLEDLTGLVELLQGRRWETDKELVRPISNSRHSASSRAVKENWEMILSSRFYDAVAFAGKLHANQVRKGSETPYIAHLLSVTSIAIEHGADEDEAVAALLHDAIEDQGGATIREEIRRRFGDHVVEIVDGCTDAEDIPKPPWRERKEAHIAHVRHASRSVLLVVAADKLHNARTILVDYRRSGKLLWDRFTGGRKGTLWY